MIRARDVRRGYGTVGGPYVESVSTIVDDDDRGITTLAWTDGTVTYSEPNAKMLPPERPRSMVVVVGSYRQVQEWRNTADPALVHRALWSGQAVGGRSFTADDVIVLGVEHLHEPGVVSRNDYIWTLQTIRTRLGPGEPERLAASEPELWAAISRPRKDLP